MAGRRLATSAAWSATLRAAACAAIASGAIGAAPLEARVLKNQADALALAFGSDARIERKSVFLTDAEVESVKAMAGKGVEVPSPLVTRYEGTRDGKSLGHAYFDTHLVRTLPETVMIVIAPSGAIERVEVIAFAEPEDYLPRPRWYEQFVGRTLDRELAVGRGIHAITGATLSARATTDAAKRVLAIHAVVASGPGEKP